MSHQGTQVEIPDEAPPRTPSGRRTGVGDTSHARSWSRGFFVKLAVVAIAGMQAIGTNLLAKFQEVATNLL
mgnify:CR=1 FL=1